MTTTQIAARWLAPVSILLAVATSAAAQANDLCSSLQDLPGLEFRSTPNAILNELLLGYPGIGSEATEKLRKHLEKVMDISIVPYCNGDAVRIILKEDLDDQQVCLAAIKLYAPFLAAGPLRMFGPGLTVAERDPSMFFQRNYDLRLDAAREIPDDPFYASPPNRQWALRGVGTAHAWALGAYGDGATVAVIDSGTDTTTPDLDARHTNEPHLDFGEVGTSHGTRLAAIIGATTNNAQLMAGIAPNARVRGRQVTDSNFVNSSVAADSLCNLVAELEVREAGTAGSTVVLMAFSDQARQPNIESALFKAEQAGMLVVVSAGTPRPTQVDLDHYGNCRYPACYARYFPNVLAVGGITQFAELSPYSNYGSYTIELAAPGEDVTSLGFGNASYGHVNGTSAAAAIVAGGAAVVISAIRACGGEANFESIRCHLSWGAVNYPHLEGTFSDGLVLDIAGAVDSARLEYCEGVPVCSATRESSPLPAPRERFRRLVHTPPGPADEPPP